MIKKPFVSFAICVFILSGLMACNGKTQIASPPNQQTVNAPLQLILSLDKKIYFNGENINATVELKNSSDQTILIKKYLGLGPSYEPKQFRGIEFVILDSSGKTINYDFLYFVDSFPITPEDFAYLNSNQAIIEFYTNLGDSYNLKKSGLYSIQAYYENSLDPDNSHQAWKGKLYSNKINFFILP